MKICVLTHTFPRFEKDVAAPFMHGVATSLTNAGNEVFVLTPYSHKFDMRRKRNYKLITYKYIWPGSLHKLGYSETLTNDMGFPLIMWALSPFMYFFCFWRLLSLVRKEKIELINAHWILPNGFIAGAVSLLTGVPVVSTLPGSDVYIVKKNSFFNLLGKFATDKSKWITSNSGQLIIDLTKFTGINLDKKSSTIIYGVDPKKFFPTNIQKEEIRKEFGLSKSDIVILSVGRLVAKKGFVYLIKAAPSILKKNKNAKFVIIGEGDQRQELEELAKKLKVEDKFKFPGWVDYKNLIYYYNFSDVFILPSVRDKEGNLDDQSVSVVEAMACGKPIVTTNFPGYKTVVAEGENGFLTPEKNEKKIAEVLKKLVRSKALREKMGKESRKRIQEFFAWDAIGRQYTQLFKTLNKNYYSIGVPKILNEKERVVIAKQLLEVIKHEVKDTKKLTCLDVGSSSGAISNYLADHFKNVTATDIDENAINIAKNKYSKKNLNFIVVKDEKLDFKNNNFDVVICNQVYNFVESPKKLVEEIYRVLKPNGVCLFGGRNKYALMEPQYGLPFLSWIPSILPFGKNYMSYFELKNLVKKFKVNDYTTSIIKNPRKYGFKKLEKYTFLMKVLPIDMLKFFIPNYIFALRKK